MSRHTALQFVATCQSQPQLAGFGHHPSLGSNALLKGEVEHPGTLSKPSAMLAPSIVTNTSQHVRAPAHKLPHAFSHVLPGNFLPKTQRPAKGIMKIVDCNMVSHSSRSFMDASPSYAARWKSFTLGWAERRGRSEK